MLKNVSQLRVEKNMQGAIVNVQLQLELSCLWDIFLDCHATFYKRPKWTF